MCPFCEELYEGRETCPVHDLDLIRPTDVKPKRQDPREHDFFALREMRYGRGWLLSAAVLLILGFLLPFVTLVQKNTLTLTTLEVAARRAPNLFSLVLVSGLCISVFFRTRTRYVLRGQRIGLGLLASLAGLSLGYTVTRIWLAAEAQSAAREAVHTEFRFGIIVLAAGVVALVFAAFRAGGDPPRETFASQSGETSEHIEHNPVPPEQQH